MSVLVNIVSILKYIGLLGIPVLYSSDAIWKVFALFWLFGILEIVLTLPVFIQTLNQLIAIPIIYIRYKFKLPDVCNYIPKVYYSLPFREKWTVINGSVYKDASHSWNILSQRYAYDFVILDKEGKSMVGDKKKAENYYCYGKDVLAPADGIVVEVKENHKDSKIYGFRLMDKSITDIRGNYIVIKHAENEYSCLAHLQPHSIKVKKGQYVRRGEVIAKCGNSGNSSEPHLHFQIQDRKSFFYSMGLPIHFTDIHKEATQNYMNFDKRKIPDNIDIDNSEFIHRGVTVSNINKECQADGSDK